MGSLLQDLRYAFRTLIKSPGFTVVALIALGIGIGANTAIFSVVNAVLIRPLPFHDPDRLVVLWETDPEKGGAREDVSAPNYLDWRARAEGFDELSAWYQWRQALTGLDEPREIESVRVSPALFPMLGVDAVVGRTFTTDEDQPGRHQVVVLSHGFWQQYFGADPEAIGSTMTLGGDSYTVVGVMAAGFRFPDDDNVALWLPLAFRDFEINYRYVSMFNVLGRLAPGVSLEEARAEMTVIARALEEEYPSANSGRGIEIVPAWEVLVGSNRQLLILLGAVGFILLIACANVANLMLARAADREKEIAIRTAMGAGRVRLVRQLLAESALLAGLGGSLGLLLAIWGMDLIGTLDPGNISGWNEVRIDLHVLSFTAGLALLTALISGLVPALQASKPDLNESLKAAGGRSTVAARIKRTRGLLVVAQVSLAVVLLISAGLLVNSFARVQQVDPGFNPNNLMAAWIELPENRYPNNPEEIAFFEELLTRVRNLPGAIGAGLVTTLPMNPVGTDYDLGFTVPGQGRSESDVSQADFRLVSTEYFRTMGIPLLSGRDFTKQEGTAGVPGVIINSTLARRFFPDVDPLGKSITIRSGGENLKVVGVIGDVHHHGLDAQPRPEMFVPYKWAPHGGMSLVVRTAGDPLSMAEAVKRQVYALDPDQPISELTTVPALISGSVAHRRNRMLILASFATFGLVLAATGIYGVISYSVSQRTREIGIRIAIGARRSEVLKMVVSHGVRLAALGLAVGLAGALAATRMISSLLYEVSPTDPATFVSVAIILTGVSLAASYFPARRATKVDPLVALRHE